MDLHSSFLCNIILFSIRIYFHHQSHPRLGIVFALAQCLHSGAIFSPFSSSILSTYRPGEFIFQGHIFLPFFFFTVHGILKARILKWFAIPFSSEPCFVRTLHHDPFIMHGSTWHAHSLTELDKVVIQVINLVNFL